MIFALLLSAVMTIADCFDPQGGHIQGMCHGDGYYYLTQMTGIYKINSNGVCVAKTKAISHTGDI